MFNVGDTIIYGSTGVCRIKEIKEIDYTGNGGKLFYIIQPLNQSCTISSPVDGGKVFMRRIISRERVNELIDLIPTIKPKAFHSRATRELTEHYSSILNTHDCGELIELTMSIYEKKKLLSEQNRKFGAIDEKFMKRAEDLLFGEFSAALQIPVEQVPKYISSRVEALKA